MSDELRILKLRADLRELGSAMRQLRQAGGDGATAELLLSRKRAELEDMLSRRKHAAGVAPPIDPPVSGKAGTKTLPARPSAVRNDQDDADR